MKALLLGRKESGKFSGQRFIWKKDIASLKRLMSFARQMPQMLGRGQQKRKGDGERDTYRELLPFFNVRSGQEVPPSR